MVVPSTKLEGLSDALEMTDVIIETAKQLKASLNQAKRANTPAALAAASATLGLARTVVTFSRGMEKRSKLSSTRFSLTESDDFMRMYRLPSLGRMLPLRDKGRP